MDRALVLRAEGIARRVAPHLPPGGRVVDIGCGTGHNGRALEARLGLSVRGVDVVDLGVLGPAPTLFDGKRLPFEDGAFDAGLLLFVLQYPDDPAALLAEAARVARGPVVVLQSTYRGPAARLALAARSRLLGLAAYEAGRRVGLVRGGARAALTPRRAFARPRLLALCGEVGLRVAVLEPEPSLTPGLGRDLLRLERR